MIVELYIVIFRSRIKVAHTIRLMMKHSWYNLQEGNQLKIPADDDQDILLKYKSPHTRESHRLWHSWNPKLLMKLVASYTGIRMIQIISLHFLQKLRVFFNTYSSGSKIQTLAMMTTETKNVNQIDKTRTHNHRDREQETNVWKHERRQNKHTSSSTRMSLRS
jgi:hypothetical protein